MKLIVAKSPADCNSNLPPQRDKVHSSVKTSRTFKKIGRKQPFSRLRAVQKLFYGQLDDLDIFFLRIADGVPRSAGHAVVAGDKDARIIYHEAVSYRHARRTVALGKHCDFITIIYDPVVSQAVILVPVIGLPPVRNSGLERNLRSIFLRLMTASAQYISQPSAIPQIKCFIPESYTAPITADSFSLNSTHLGSDSS